MASAVAARRAAEEMRPNHRPGQPHRYGHRSYTPETVRALHHVGVLSELAFARYYGLPFRDDFRPDAATGDVAGRQVRSTGHRTGCLRMHESDPDHHPFHLVIRQDGNTRFRVAGWLFGREAKRLGSRCEPQKGRPCILVPQAQLRKPPIPLHEEIQPLACAFAYRPVMEAA